MIVDSKISIFEAPGWNGYCTAKFIKRGPGDVVCLNESTLDKSGVESLINVLQVFLKDMRGPNES